MKTHPDAALDAGVPIGMALPRNITIEDIRDPARLHEVEALQIAVWGMDPGGVVPSSMLYAVIAAGGVVLGAYDGQILVGFVLGLFGQRDGRRCHVSHMLGIQPDYQGHGLGAALKLRQREHALAQGLDLMTWTFDPLEARNAYFNLHKLGAVSRLYRENLYGEMQDDLNRGLPTDRLVAEWYLRVAPGSHRVSPLEAPVSILSNLDGTPRLHLDPAVLGSMLHLAVPDDVRRYKRDEPERALAWRLAVRQALCWAFEHGYLVRDFAGGAYLLVPDAAR